MCAEDGTTGHEIYEVCHYDGSRLALRGPERSFDDPFVAVLGGSETFGKDVQHPFPALLEDWVGQPVINLGVMHAGVSLFSEERWLLDIASRARLTVMQVMGAQNMSNRLYCVHPRRNDRFLTTSEELRHMYPDIDFTDFSFTGHLMSGLEAGPTERFASVVEELRWAWVQRMRRVLTTVRSDVLLLWLSGHSPDDPAAGVQGCEPAFVTRAMLDQISDCAAGLVEVIRPLVLSQAAGVSYHAAIAEALAGPVARLIGEDENGPRLSAEANGFPGAGGAQSFSISSGTAVNRSATRP